MSMDFAKLESLMFERMDLKNEQERIKERKQSVEIQMQRILKENRLDEHRTNYDEHRDIRVQLKDRDKKIFEKERMATDLNIAESATVKKDVLINMTEQGKLNVRTFKEYFHKEPEEKVSLRLLKKKKPKKKK